MPDAPNNMDRFAEMPFPIEVELGRVSLDLETLLKLQEGDLLRTDQPAGIPVLMLGGGVELAYAELLTMNDKVVARISRVAAPAAASTAANAAGSTPSAAGAGSTNGDS